MSEKTLKLSVLRVIWTASILVAVMSFVGERFGSFLWSTPRVHSGGEFPASPPREENRVTSEAGFSLIPPEGWETVCRENELLFVPRDSSPNGNSLQVRLLEDPYRHPVPLPENHQFQNRPAYSVVRTEPASIYEPERHVLYVVIERNRQLYELHYESAGQDEPGISENVWNYLETFAAAPESTIGLR